MKILIYDKPDSINVQKLLDKIKAKIPSDTVEMFYKRDLLVARIIGQPSQYDIILLFCHALNDLKYFISQKDTLRHYRIIMVIPDSETDSAKQAHQLYPRYLTYLTNESEDVKAVLLNMVNYIKKVEPEPFEPISISGNS